MPRAIGIDVTTQALRVVEVEKYAEGFRLTSAFTVQTSAFAPAPEEDNGESHAKRQEQRIANLHQGLEKLSTAGLSIGPGVAGISGQDLMVRYTRIPAVPEHRQKLLIDLEIGEMSQQGGEQLAHDFTVLPAALSAGSDDTVLVGLAKNDTLEDTVDLLRGFGLRPTRVTPSCLGLYNAYALTGEFEPDETVMVASIGYEQTELAIVHEGALLFARNINHGGKGLAEIVKEQTNSPLPKAWKALLTKCDVTPPTRGARDGGKLQVGLWGAAEDLQRLLESSINFAKLQLKNPRLNINKIYLTGELARLKGLPEFISQRFNRPVSLYDPFATLGEAQLPGAAMRGDSDPTAFPHQYAVALGLARIGIERDLLALNLIPESVISRRRFFDRSLFLYLGVFLLVLLPVLWILKANEGLDAAEGVTAQLNDAKRRADSAVREAQQAHEDYRATVPLTRSLEAAVLPSVYAMDVIHALRGIATDVDEMILRDFTVVPPSGELDDPTEVRVHFYLEELGARPVTELNYLIEQRLRDAVPEGVIQNLFSTETTRPDDDDTDSLQSGSYFEMRITLKPPAAGDDLR